MVSAPSTPRTLPSLTGLRAVAAGLVFVRHAGYLFDTTSIHRWTWRLFVQGSVGVSFFFVLSGFVLTWSWRPGLLGFYRRRFARIYPAYFASTILAAIVTVSLGGRVSGSVAAAHLALLQSWFSSERYTLGLNGVSWSLSCEAFFYLLFPLIIVVASRVPPRLRKVVLLCVVISIVAVPTFVTASTVIRQIWLTYIFPPTRLLEFTCGVLLALAVREGAWPRIPLRVAVPFALIGYVIAGEAGEFHPGVFTVYHGYAATTIVPFTVLIGAFAMSDIAQARTVMRSATMIRLGELSYAFFLLHFLVIQVFRHYAAAWSPDVLGATGASLALFGVALVMALALYQLLEAPAERKLRGARSRQSVTVLLKSKEA